MHSHIRLWHLLPFSALMITKDGFTAELGYAYDIMPSTFDPLWDTHAFQWLASQP
jgi:hypothetical protein